MLKLNLMLKMMAILLTAGTESMQSEEDIESDSDDGGEDGQKGIFGLIAMSWCLTCWYNTVHCFTSATSLSSGNFFINFLLREICLLQHG